MFKISNIDMKKIFYIIGLTFGILSCDTNDDLIDYDKIELKSYIIDNYYNDAKQLYFNEIIQNRNHNNFNNPILDNREINKILKIIQAVYDSDSTERDIVFDFYQIHGYYCYSFNSISLKVETNKPEIENLSKGIIPTGKAKLDNLLTSYDFDSVRTSYSYPDFPWLTIYTKDEYNMIPIEREFEAIESVLIAEFSKGCVGDGNNISLTRSNSSATITFSIGSGDCPAGCIYHKYWEFKVSNGYAKFVRTYED
ncbi:hypothetical protein [Lutibacter sp. B1]|uniref:hypothetical protein n=1 Tax=Lutibacter sp. B1 TaxID=2725996 RepID=UPI0014567CDF|nr:hypothetical protein [Lutibacter sp. B1]NLP57576.1 hypothetical protein [Lutibacter sp. B1]